MRVPALLLLLLAVVLPGGACAAGRHRPPAADLGGYWSNTFLTELERPVGIATLTLPDAEATALEARRLAAFRNVQDGVGGRESETGFWEIGTGLARIGGQARTSWIVEPADGHLPWSAAGKAARDREVAARSGSADPEARNVSERCLISGFAAAGPPMLSSPYGTIYQIVQTRDAVAISIEANHDVRIVRLGAGGHGQAPAHLPASVRPWLGDSVGRWAGKTLVVETTNFNPGDALKMPIGLYISRDATVTERFTRLSPTELLYDFTVDDPASFTRVWRAQMLFRASKGPAYEYACHEGNYALPGILAGARREEADARAAGR